MAGFDPFTEEPVSRSFEVRQAAIGVADGRGEPAAAVDVTSCSRTRLAAPLGRRSRVAPVRGVAGVAAQGCRPAGSGYHAPVQLISQEGMLARVKKLTEAMTKTQMLSDIAEKTELTRRQVADVFEALESVIERHVQKGAVGACTIPGLMKIKVMMKPAQRARKNVPNPFRPGETMDVKAKPASTSVKVLPLKKLKDMA